MRRRMQWLNPLIPTKKIWLRGLTKFVWIPIILQASRNLLKEQGWTAINIRAVAAACHVSVGSIYNYFGSKADLVSNTVESVWHEIFHEPADKSVFRDIQSCVAWMYERMAFGSKEYPGFFILHSMNFMSEGKEDGKKKMQQIFVEWCSRIPTSGQMPLMMHLHRHISQMYFFPWCSLPCSARITIRKRRCSLLNELYIKKIPTLRGNFI